jgi:hypothetical protein
VKIQFVIRQPPCFVCLCLLVGRGGQSRKPDSALQKAHIHRLLFGRSGILPGSPHGGIARGIKGNHAGNKKNCQNGRRQILDSSHEYLPTSSVHPLKLAARSPQICRF